MKVIEHINNSTDTQFSYEIIPPLRGKGIKIIIAMIIGLKTLNIKNGIMVERIIMSILFMII